MELSDVIKDCETIISSIKTYLKVSSEEDTHMLQSDILYYETLRGWLMELKQRREADKWREDYMAERADEV